MRARRQEIENRLQRFEKNFPVRIPLPPMAALRSTDPQVGPGTLLQRYVAQVVGDPTLHVNDYLLARADYADLLREVRAWLQRHARVMCKDDRVAIGIRNPRDLARALWWWSLDQGPVEEERGSKPLATPGLVYVRPSEDRARADRSREHGHPAGVPGF
jgi:hypothetical protein